MVDMEGLERLIDWMALNGINMPLAITGQESGVQLRMDEIRLTDEELELFHRACSLALKYRMSNLGLAGGPLLPKEMAGYTC